MEVAENSEISKFSDASELFGFSDSSDIAADYPAIS